MFWYTDSSLVMMMLFMLQTRQERGGLPVISAGELKVCSEYAEGNWLVDGFINLYTK